MKTKASVTIIVIMMFFAAGCAVGEGNPVGPDVPEVESGDGINSPFWNEGSGSGAVDDEGDGGSDFSSGDRSSDGGAENCDGLEPLSVRLALPVKYVAKSTLKLASESKESIVTYADGSRAELSCRVGERCDFDLDIEGGDGNYHIYWRGVPRWMDDEGKELRGSPTMEGAWKILARVEDGCGERAFYEIELIAVEPEPETEDEYEYRSDLRSNVVVDHNFNQAEIQEVTKIKLTIESTRLRWAGTDGGVYVTFCDNPQFENCKLPSHYIDADGDTLDRWRRNDTFTISASSQLNKMADGNPENLMVKDIRYFKLLFRDEVTLEQDSPYWYKGIWSVMLVKVVYETDDGEERLLYYNPCVSSVVYDGDSLRFGIEDEAICANITTGKANGAGTDDDVFLEMPLWEDDETDYHDYWDNHHNGNYNRSGIAPVLYHSSDELDLSLNWGFKWYDKFEVNSSYDDRESGDTQSYGYYYFDGPMFESQHKVRLQKSRDGRHGAWQMAKAIVYAYRPAKSFALDEDGEITLKDPGARDGLVKMETNRTYWFSSDYCDEPQVRGYNCGLQHPAGKNSWWHFSPVELEDFDPVEFNDIGRHF